MVHREWVFVRARKNQRGENQWWCCSRDVVELMHVFLAETLLSRQNGRLSSKQDKCIKTDIRVYVAPDR